MQTFAAEIELFIVEFRVAGFYSVAARRVESFADFTQMGSGIFG